MTDLLATGGIILDTPINRGNMPAVPVITGMDLGEKPVSYDGIWTRVLNNLGEGTISPIVPTDRLLVPAGYHLASNISITKDGLGNMVFSDGFGTYLLSDLVGGGGSMVYPGAGIAISTGSAWGTSITPATGYLRYTGSAFEWKNETYSLSNHVHAESTITFTDITTNNATTGQHGYLPKLGGGTSNFLRADGTWSTPPVGGNVSNTGTPVDNQLAVWTNATTIEGTTGLTYNGSSLSLVGAASGLLAQFTASDGFGAIKLSKAKLEIMRSDNGGAWFALDDTDNTVRTYFSYPVWQFYNPATGAMHFNSPLCPITWRTGTNADITANTLLMSLSNVGALSVINSVLTNTINEYTATAGVTVDGVLLKDFGVWVPITTGGVWFGETVNKDGFYQGTDNQLKLMLNNGDYYTWTTGAFRMTGNGGFAIAQETPTATNPVFCPINTDLNTGVGGAATTVSLIVSSTERLRADATGVKLNIIGELTTNAGITFGNRLLTPASTTSYAGLNIPHGSAPSSPANGDMWTTTAGLYIRINNGTIGPLGSGGAGDTFKTWHYATDAGYTWGTTDIVAASNDTMDIVPGSGISIATDPTLKAIRITATGGGGDTTNITWVLAAGEAATTGTNKTNAIVIPRAGTIQKVFAYAKTGPTGAALIFDINKNGTTIWSTQANRIQIAAGAIEGTQTSFNTTSLAEGDIITIDVDQIGSTIAGQDITIILKFS